MKLNKEISFKQYVNNVIEKANLNVNQINLTLRTQFKVSRDNPLHQLEKNYRLSDKNINMIATVLHRPFSEVYWYHLIPQDRQNSNPSVSLPLLSKILQLNLKYQISNEMLIHKLNVTNTCYYNWRKLRKPIESNLLPELAQIYHINVSDLQRLQYQTINNYYRNQNLPPKLAVNGNPNPLKASHNQIIVKPVPNPLIEQIQQLTKQQQIILTDLINSWATNN